MADPQVGIVELERVRAVDRVLVVTHHRPLLKSCSFRALERDAASVSVAQVINLSKKFVNFFIDANDTNEWYKQFYSITVLRVG